ncbi:MAG: hypothetical protein HZC55_01180 [Verrucomicrobia bacterium]|nr:hypothetical protein [Verrucomicrobiota bacterium]
MSWLFSRDDLEKTRFESALAASEAEWARLRPADTPPAWAVAARSLLDAARAAAGKKDGLQQAWMHLGEARRELLGGAPPAELTQRAIELRTESDAKLDGWRREAVRKLLNDDLLKRAAAELREGHAGRPPVPELGTALQNATKIMNERHNCVHLGVQLASAQLTVIVAVLAAQVVALLLVLWRLDGCGCTGDGTAGELLAVALMGGIGACVSAVFQLSRLGRTKLPDQLLQYSVTFARPLVGVASALFLYWFVRSGVFSLVDAEKLTRALALALGFAAGFSEKLVIQTVAAVRSKTGEEPKS